MVDAIRIRDQRKVALKIVPTMTKELPIWQYLTSPAMLADKRNHCIPLLDIHPIPGDDEEAIAVMPLLTRFNLVPFYTVGEVLACLYHLLEVRRHLRPLFRKSTLIRPQGLAFMHEKNVAHM